MSIERHTEKLSYKNIDYYFHLYYKRKLIQNISASYFVGRFLDIGCGEMPYKSIIEESSKIIEYLGLDIDNEIYQKNIKPDLFWDGITIPLYDNSVDSCMLIEVLEHVPYPEVVLKEINRVMNPGSYCLITVPFLWNLHDVPRDEYRFTPFALRRILENTGFHVLQMNAFGGWHSSLATIMSLYVRRGIKRYWLKGIASWLLLPVVKFLFKKDENSKFDFFHEGLMIPGLWCLIQKKINV